jgi:hypothetical protein
MKRFRVVCAVLALVLALLVPFGSELIKIQRFLWTDLLSLRTALTGLMSRKTLTPSWANQSVRSSSLDHRLSRSGQRAVDGCRDHAALGDVNPGWNQKTTQKLITQEAKFRVTGLLFEQEHPEQIGAYMRYSLETNCVSCNWPDS